MGQVWHLPGPATGTTRALLDLLAGQVGHRVAVRSLPKLAVRTLGLVNPVLRELAETSYQFDEPFVLDTSKYQAAFGTAGTPLADAIGRASDFYGPGVTEGSTRGERVCGNALAGRRADFIGDPGVPHTYSYVPDIAAGLATLGTDARAVGQVWHLPGPATGTTRALLDLVAGQVGLRVAVRSLPKLAVRALGLVNPTIRELAEMSYECRNSYLKKSSNRTWK